MHEMNKGVNGLFFYYFFVVTFRVANAPHRSLPDLPAEIGDAGGDNNSDLYATVGDKMQPKPVEKSREYFSDNLNGFFY